MRCGRLLSSQQSGVFEAHRQVVGAFGDHLAVVGERGLAGGRPSGQVVGIADRADTLVGIFAAGLRPTGNKDPFALRRGALGMVRILLEGGLQLPLNRILALAANAPAGSHYLFRNDLESTVAERSIQVLVLDENGHYTRAGSEVRVYRSGTDELIGLRLVDTGSGYNAQNAKPVHIGLPEPIYLVLVPSVRVDTGKIFQDPELTRNSRRITIRDFVAGEASNDCLGVVRKRYPQVAQAFDWLDETLDARLTGTGACVFAACADRAQAEALLHHKPDGTTGFVVQASNHSALLETLEQAE